MAELISEADVSEAEVHSKPSWLRALGAECMTTPKHGCRYRELLNAVFFCRHKNAVHAWCLALTLVARSFGAGEPTL